MLKEETNDIARIGRKGQGTRERAKKGKIHIRNRIEKCEGGKKVKERKVRKGIH